MLKQFGVLAMLALMLAGCATETAPPPKSSLSVEDARYALAGMSLAKTAKTHFMFAESMRRKAFEANGVLDPMLDIVLLADSVNAGEEEYAAYELMETEQRAILRANADAFEQSQDEMHEILSGFPEPARHEALALVDRQKVLYEQAVKNAEDLMELFGQYAKGDADVLNADLVLQRQMQSFLFDYADIISATYAYESARVTDLSKGMARPVTFGIGAEYISFLHWQSKAFADVLKTAFSEPCVDGQRSVPTGIDFEMPGETDIEQMVKDFDLAATGFGVLALSGNGSLSDHFMPYIRQTKFVEDTRKAIKANEEERLAVFEVFVSMVQSPEFASCDYDEGDEFMTDMLAILVELTEPYELNAERNRVRLEYYDSAIGYYQSLLDGTAGAN